MQTTVEKDPATRSMTVTVELDVPVERAWQLWADPRQLERWWGPPGAPAKVLEHELSPGGRMHYAMVTPDGEHHGIWEVLTVDAPTGLTVVDHFADDTGTPIAEMPASEMTIELLAGDGGTTMRVRSVYASLEAMEQVIAMGIEEGMRAAIGQIADVLAAA